MRGDVPRKFRHVVFRHPRVTPHRASDCKLKWETSGTNEFTNVFDAITQTFLARAPLPPSHCTKPPWPRAQRARWRTSAPRGSPRVRGGGRALPIFLLIVGDLGACCGRCSGQGAVSAKAAIAQHVQPESPSMEVLGIVKNVGGSDSGGKLAIDCHRTSAWPGTTIMLPKTGVIWVHSNGLSDSSVSMVQ